LRVVDEDEQRVRLGRRGKQAERGGADGEAVMWPGVLETQSASERVRLLFGELLEVVQQRPRELEQAGELELGLVLDPDCPDDGHPLGAFGGVVEQGGLAESRLTTNHERAATPPASATEELLDARAVGFPTDEQAFTVARFPGRDKD
jgi:hypothetical protein